MADTERYPIPAAPAETEIRVSNSRFIGCAAGTPTVEDSRAFLATVRERYPDATHHAYAALVGYGASVVAAMSDDGEPSGTAGRPMLAVLRGSDLGDVTVVVTRYFGGTLLGTGGLVRAYSDATRAVLEILPRKEYVETCSLQVCLDYSDYTPARQVLVQWAAAVEQETFAEHVTLVVQLPRTNVEGCTATLAELTAGRAGVRVL
jgi:uncharacterized YigZ family protein